MKSIEKSTKKYICTIENQAEIKYAQDALFVLSGKWTMPIVITLFNGIHRYREIAKDIPGLTYSMLSRELKHLELNKIVIRKEDPDFPKDVEYHLTEYCLSIFPLVEKLIEWGREHRQILAE